MTLSIALYIVIVLTFWFNMSKRMIDVRKSINYGVASPEEIAGTMFLVAPFFLIFSEVMRSWEVNWIVKYFLVAELELAVAMIIDYSIDYFYRTFSEIKKKYCKKS